MPFKEYTEKYGKEIQREVKKKKKFLPIFTHQVQSHILAEADNDRFQEGLGGGGCQEQSPPRNSSTSSSLPNPLRPTAPPPHIPRTGGWAFARLV